MSLLDKISDLAIAIGNDMKGKENKINFWSLIHGASLRVLISNDASGKKYEYHYGTTVLYRFITADKSDDSFFSDENLTNKIATKKVVVNL